MDAKRKGEIALSLCALLAADDHEFGAFEGSEPAYSYVEGLRIDRSELQSFGNWDDMRKLGIAIALDNERKSEIAYAVVKFEFGFNELDLRGKTGSIANRLGVTEIEFAAFLACARMDFAREPAEL